MCAHARERTVHLHASENQLARVRTRASVSDEGLIFRASPRAFFATICLKALGVGVHIDIQYTCFGISKREHHLLFSACMDRLIYTRPFQIVDSKNFDLFRETDIPHTCDKKALKFYPERQKKLPPFFTPT